MKASSNTKICFYVLCTECNIKKLDTSSTNIFKTKCHLRFYQKKYAVYIKFVSRWLLFSYKLSAIPQIHHPNINLKWQTTTKRVKTITLHEIRSTCMFHLRKHLLFVFSILTNNYKHIILFSHYFKFSRICTTKNKYFVYFMMYKSPKIRNKVKLKWYVHAYW